MAWESVLLNNAKNLSISRGIRIATLVCGLVRNDRFDRFASLRMQGGRKESSYRINPKMRYSTKLITAIPAQ